MNSPKEVILALSRMSSSSPFTRFFSCMLKTSIGRGFDHSTASASAVAGDAPFPMLLSFPEAHGRKVSEVNGKEESKGPRRAAMQWVNWTLAYFSWLSLGGRGAKADGWLAQTHAGSLSSLQLDIAHRLLRDALAFLRDSGGEIPSLGRGRARLRDMLDAMTRSP